MERVRNFGFTVVELVLTIALMGILVLVSGIIMGRAIESYRLVVGRSETVTQSSQAFLRMQRELETLRSVTVAQSSRIVFQDPAGAAVEFRLDGTTLFRGSSILAENISGLSLTYFREDGNGTVAGPQVRRIHLEMTSERGAEGSLALRTDVFPRIYMYENFQ